ncbi:MAG: 4Fe-4S dicluster domain-containing protein [Eggerthellaceae bacterium]|nr:4Fe-4S dicluster domain-containing protein [Eggerthellaceae bacterium]
MCIDLHRCIGCHSCSAACRTWNDLPIDIIYNPVLGGVCEGTWPNVHRNYLPTLCMHCKNPECVPCCPTGASQQDEDGVVWVDTKICMGCKVCVNACPYGMRDTSHTVRRFDEFVRKCTFCKERREMEPGADPYCVQTCHQHARTFGDIDDPNSEISRLIGRSDTFRLLEELGTDPQIYYIPDMGGTR